MSRLGRLLDRIHPPAYVSERQRIERVLASARAFVAASCVAVVYFDPLTPSRYSALAGLLLAIYLAASVALLVMAHRQRDVRPSVQVAAHGIDVLWAALVPLFSDSDHALAFIAFLFMVVAAVARWGTRQAFASAGVVLAVLFFEDSAATPFFDGAHAPARFGASLVRTAYLIIGGSVVAYVARQAKSLYAASSVVARIVGQVQAEASLRATLQTASSELLEFLGGTQLLLATEEIGTGRAFLWDADRQAMDGEVTFRGLELHPADRATYLFPARAPAWLAVQRRRPGGSGNFRFVALDVEGRRVSGAPARLPDRLASARPVRAIMAVAVTLGDQFTGRVLLVNPRDHGVGALRLFQQLMRQLAPAVYGVHVAHGLRSRIGAIERARVARELHDGVVQSLIGAELQIDVARRRIEPEAPRLGREVGRIQDLLRQEVANLRDITAGLRAHHVGPAQLLDRLADAVDRFQRETGIAARFESSGSRVTLAPRACREILRIVHEGLANVRRHSDARHVLVAFSATGHRWTLTIDDDGRGFPFDGRFEQAALDVMREGPRVIKERVRELGGRLVLQSAPGRGAHLEITCP